MEEKIDNYIEDDSQHRTKINNNNEENYEPIAIPKNENPQNTNINTIQNQSFTHEKNNLLSLNTEFDEIIYFNNYCSVFRKIEFNNPISQEYFPYIPSREFLYSYFEDKRIIKKPSQETKTQIIGRIKQYSITKDDKFTTTFLNNMNLYAEIIGLESTSNLLLPALAKIVDETVAVKIFFLKKLSPLIDYLSSQGDEGINLLKKNVINIIEELYHPRGFEIKDEEMKNLLFDNFIKAAKSIIPKDKDNYILNMVISFGYEENSNKDFILEHKILCIKFISELAGYFGKDNAINYLLPQLSFFADEQEQNIKKEILKTLPSLCEVLPYEIVRVKIYKLIKKIANDTLWRIRKTCIEVLSKILKIYKTKVDNFIKTEVNYDPKKLSAKHYVTLIEKFILDEQKYVRNTIIERIGEIITSIDKERDGLSMKLFNFYKESVENYYFNKSKILSASVSVNSGYTINTVSSKMSTLTNRSKYSKEDINYYFAYNFPAILYVYGKECWPKLRKIYGNLCNETSGRIRMSIISSFYEICKMVEKENIEIDLLQYYDIFLESEDSKEKNIAIRYLPKILNLVSKEARQKYLKYFDAVSIFQDNAGDKVRNFNFISWKNKLDVIEGILCYFNLYENDIIYKSIIPQCITFCLDPIYKVRAVSSKVLGKLILYLYNENYKKKELFKILDSFAFHKKYHQRINFIKICKILINNKNIYYEKIMELFFIISSYEKILNVEIALCKLIKKILLDNKSACYGELSIYKICQILLNKHKNITIKNIFKDINIKDIDEKNNNIFNQYLQKFKGKEIIFNGDNQYFIKEFNIDYEEDKNNKNFDVDGFLNSQDRKEKSEIKENELPKEQINPHLENKNGNYSENSSTEFLNIGPLFQKTENNVELLNKDVNFDNKINNINNENNINDNKEDN